MSRRKLLWVGDAVAATGFARATHHTLDILRESWDVAVCGINYDGDPHTFPYPIYPAARAHRPEDMFGVRRIGPLVASLNPDLIVLLNDPWNVPRYVEAIRAQDEDVPIVGWMAVDGKNCRGHDLDGLDKALFWTRFGEEQARLGGFAGPTGVVPLGVDLATYAPRGRREAREHLKLPDYARDAFIVGAVGRNQQRKRLDLTIDYFATFLQETGVDAQLLLHVAPTGEQGFDLKQMGDFYGLRGRVLVSSPNFYHGVVESDMPMIYSAMDVYMSTTQGEGFGLTALEAMACGTACALSDWAAYGEWARGAAYLVPCSDIVYTPTINAQGGLADRRGFVEALTHLYAESARRSYARAGFARAHEPRFRWRNIGEAFAREIEQFAPASVSQFPTMEDRHAAAGN